MGKCNLINDYFDKPMIVSSVELGRHREMVGGLWDEVGRLQFDCAVGCGLRPRHALIDVGCGSLRGGVHFAAYLEPGNYYGIDLNESLIDAGYEHELRPRGLSERVPRGHLRQTDNFEFEVFDQEFDYAIAISVFTHLPMNQIRVCLEKLQSVMQPSGVLLATVFLTKVGCDSYEPQLQQPGGITTYGDRDPYHYHFADIEYLARSAGWVAELLMEFRHPGIREWLGCG